MALRAGYYGVKRFLRNKLETIARTYDDTIKSLFPRSEQAVLGARNLVKFPYVKLDGSYSAVSVTVNNDGSLLLNGTASTDAFIIFHVRQGSSPTDNNPVILKAGTYNVYKGDNANDVSLRLNKTVNGNAVTLVELSGSTKKGTFTLTEETQIGMIIDITNGTAVTNNVVKPMITFGDDKNETITPYAMTNKELTTSASDQKTAINAIITAATGAADFAAFKTAMGAITPVTRSLSLTKEDITEEVKEDVEPEKTVTKKRTTKKTEEV